MKGVIRYARAVRFEAVRPPHRPGPQLPPLDRGVDTRIGLRIGYFEIAFHKNEFKVHKAGKVNIFGALALMVIHATA